MTSVNVTTDVNTVTVSDDGGNIAVVDNGGAVIVTTDGVTQETFDALQARVAALEALDIMLLEG